MTTNTSPELVDTCEILRAVIVQSDGTEFSISNLITGINLTESIEQVSLRGHVTILDTIGLVENYEKPFRGEERLYLDLKSLDNNVIKKLDLFIYKIDNITIKETNDGARYVLHFVTTTSFISSTRKLITSFNAPISDIVRDVFDASYAGIKRVARPSDYGLTPGSTTFNTENILGADFFRYGDDKGIFVERTEGNFKCVIPNYRPNEAMSFLASRAYSEESPSCSYKFFETKDGYMFVTDEYLIKYAIENKLEREFTYKPIISKDMMTLPDQVFNLSHLENVKRVDTALDLYSGAYTNNVVVLDLLNREVVEHKYTYEQDGKPSYVKMNKIQETNSEVHRSEFIEQTFNSENERKFLIIKDYDNENSVQLRGEQFLPKIISNKVAYNHMLNNTILSVSIAGRLDIKAGDIAKLLIPEFTSFENKKLNPQLSGNYIVHGVDHNIIGRTLKTSMKLVKYGWSI